MDNCLYRWFISAITEKKNSKLLNNSGIARFVEGQIEKIHTTMFKIIHADFDGPYFVLELSTHDNRWKAKNWYKCYYYPDFGGSGNEWPGLLSDPLGVWAGLRALFSSICLASLCAEISQGPKGPKGPNFGVNDCKQLDDWSLKNCQQICSPSDA